LIAFCSTEPGAIVPGFLLPARTGWACPEQLPVTRHRQPILALAVLLLSTFRGRLRR
jgi:hypothetical protein